MVKGLLFAITLASVSPGVSETPPVQAASVAVEHDGRWRADPYGDQTPAQCRRFRVSPAMARRWFAKAKAVSQQEWLEQLDWTQCSADGTLRTRGGRTYRWELDQSGRGRIVLSPTRSVYLSGRELPFNAH